MPIYVYHCKACGNREEHIQKFSDAAIEECASCGRPELSKQLTSAAFHLKGGGWYKDGYASSSGGASASAPAPSSTPASTPSTPASTSSTSSSSD